MVSIDKQKRKRIMQRSMKLGHCICDPKKPCPCDMFREQNVCLCAGERPEPLDISQVRLTDYVHNAGCASKVPPADLERILARMPTNNDPNILLGMPAGDDAGVYRLNELTYLVQTVDVFTPCVDDAYTFGQIAAANSVSDIYAMGGTPRTALSVLAFPSDTLPGEVMFQLMKGGLDKMAEAGVAVIGGHSIKDEEIKFGFAVTGDIDAGKIAQHDNAQVGDVLVLTKPLGTGVISFAGQIGRASKTALEQIASSMTNLNRSAAEIMQNIGVNACTDITGFGLFGHLVQLVRRSEVTATICGEKLPAFTEALQYLGDGIVPGAVERNREYVGEDLEVVDKVDGAVVDLCFDAQTSGGLLISLPSENAEELVGELNKAGTLAAAVIGRITEKSQGRIVLTAQGEPRSVEITRGKEAEPIAVGQDAGDTPCCCPQEAILAESGQAKPCCSPAPVVTTAQAGQESSGVSASSLFGKFMAEASCAKGATSAREKELINWGLVVLARCGPCVKIHYNKALKMGISAEELDEAAWLAISMGGAPVMMFYKEALKEIEEAG